MFGIPVQAYWIGGGILGGLALIGILFWQFTAYVESERQEARDAVVVECNTSKLEEELAAANQRAVDAEQREAEIRIELSEMSAEAASRAEFIVQLQALLNSLEPDRSEVAELASQTQALLRALNDRAIRTLQNESDD